MELLDCLHRQFNDAIINNTPPLDFQRFGFELCNQWLEFEMHNRQKQQNSTQQRLISEEERVLMRDQNRIDHLLPSPPIIMNLSPTTSSNT